MTTKIVKNVSFERICFTDGCTAIGQNTGAKRKDGSIVRRKYCGACHSQRTAAKHGLSNMQQVVAKNAGFDGVTKYLDHCAQKRGFANHYDVLKYQAIQAGYRSHTEMKNASHPYRKYRKNYCENQDGRLGWVCKAEFPNEDTLNNLGIEYGVSPHFDVDHIDGNPRNNKPENLQTLCKCCHSIKGLINGDLKTAGRKTLKAA